MRRKLPESPGVAKPGWVMRIEALGHVVLKVGDMERAEAFYRDVLGMTVCARREKPDMTFFTMGNHHDFAIAALGADAPRPGRKSVGLAHVAFKIGDDIEALREARAHLDAAGVRTHPVDHEVTLSLYFEDPDGNGIELYVDASDAWRDEPQRVAQGEPLEL